MNEKMLEITDGCFKSVSRKMQIIFLMENNRLSEEAMKLGLFVLERGPVSAIRAAEEFGVTTTAITGRFNALIKEIATFASYLDEFSDKTPVLDFRLNLSTVAVHGLLRSKLKTVGDVRSKSLDDLMSIRNLGKERIVEICYALIDNGVQLDESLSVFLTVYDKIRDTNIDPVVLCKYLNYFNAKSIEEFTSITIDDIFRCQSIRAKRDRRMFKYYVDKGFDFRDEVKTWAVNGTC